jgi:uncharacterized protein YfiM (DUF2279 family)
VGSSPLLASRSLALSLSLSLSLFLSLSLSLSLSTHFSCMQYSGAGAGLCLTQKMKSASLKKSILMHAQLVATRREVFFSRRRDDSFIRKAKYLLLQGLEKKSARPSIDFTFALPLSFSVIVGLRSKSSIILLLQLQHGPLASC